jgi:hypothetical protein
MSNLLKGSIIKALMAVISAEILRVQHTGVYIMMVK